MNTPIAQKRKDPVIEFRRFLTTAALEEWQKCCPQYAIFSTTFLPCKEEGHDAAIYVTCGDIIAFNSHNAEIDMLLQLRADRNDADPDVVTTPPVDRLDLSYESNIKPPAGSGIEAAIVDNPDVAGAQAVRGGGINSDLPAGSGQIGVGVEAPAITQGGGLSKTKKEK